MNGATVTALDVSVGSDVCMGGTKVATGTVGFGSGRMSGIAVSTFGFGERYLPAFAFTSRLLRACKGPMPWDSNRSSVSLTSHDSRP